MDRIAHRNKKQAAGKQSGSLANGNMSVAAGDARHTLYQVSTASALVEGVYEGAVQVAALRKHGDLGLGTFEGLDGEMVIVDGHFFQVRCDGSVREVEESVLTPFAAITEFSPECAIPLDHCPAMSHL